MGPAQGGDRYKIYDPSTKRMNVTRDVHFLEGRVRPEIYKSLLLERAEDPMLDEDDGSNAGSDEPDELAFSSIKLTPLMHHQQCAQQGEHTNTPLPSPAHTPQASSPVADHTHDRVASDGADESTENSSQNTGVGVPRSASETSASTGCSSSANKAPTGSRGKA